MEEPVSWDIPKAWEPALARARRGGVLLLLGGVDSGKSTLAVILANAALEAGRSVAVVDADVGQSSIGPPTCVSAGRVPRPLASLGEVPAERIDFVGSPSPVGHLLGAVASAQALTQWCRGTKAETIIVDTTGLISGGAARALKGAKVRLLRPDVLVALQVEKEVEPLLAPYRTRAHPETIRLAPSRCTGVRNRTDRARHREELFAAHFSGGRAHSLDWKQVAVENSPWAAGEPLPGHLRAHAESLLDVEIAHAERSAEGLWLVTSEPAPRRGLQEVEDTFGPTQAIAASVLQNLLVGLLGGQGETLALGILERVDFAARRMEVFAPLPDVGQVRGMRLGYLQLARNGVQLAWLEPTDLG